MSHFLADLHVHSRYARATSRNLDLEHLASGSAEKGIHLVATGDCTHPAWRQEMKEKLIAEGNGLFRLKPEIEQPLMKNLPIGCQTPVRFILSGEISTIYKKGDKTRKVHHLVYHSHFEAADRFAEKLAKIGNIVSDGRPILGLDSRDLLEITLESGKDSWLAPAHIWTPWFSALGSKSGFDSIDECYGDLAGHIFAAETGLSSDPEMNWRVSSLDRYRLISSSDAHSPAKLGREATLFDCDMGFQPLRHALETGEGYIGTIEFFPEEGKYHADGHRHCHISLTPKETLALGGLCPVCGKPLTIGVAHRVEALADREEGIPPSTAGKFSSLVPLPEILSELWGVGPTSRKVTQAYQRSLSLLGSELAILETVAIEDMTSIHPLLGEAIDRLRKGKVIREAGYDGEYGTIRLFEKQEMEQLTKGGLLFNFAPVRKAPIIAEAPRIEEKALALDPIKKVLGEKARQDETIAPFLKPLDQPQREAALITEKPLMVLAGPGAGKTHMLTRRVAYLIKNKGILPQQCLIVTFTRRATEELKSRLTTLIPDQASGLAIHSFHALALHILRQDSALFGLSPDFHVADHQERKKALMAAMSLSAGKAEQALKRLSELKRRGESGNAEEQQIRNQLEILGQQQNWLDFDDLIIKAVQGLSLNSALLSRWKTQFRFISVDEFQDIDEKQYQLIRLLVGDDTQLTVIGDPNQAIYSFRGADSACFDRLQQDFPAIVSVTLNRNYRSTPEIVDAANGLMPDRKGLAMRAHGEKIILYQARQESDEAHFVSQKIEEMMGGHDMLTAQVGKKTKQSRDIALSFKDFAILYRHNAQAKSFEKVFNQAGVPFRKTAPVLITSHPAVAALVKILSHFPMEMLKDKLESLKKAEIQLRTQPNKEDLEPAEIETALSWLRILAEKTGDQESSVFWEQLALATEVDFHDQRGDRVSLMTIHAAKGLEFPVVFVVGLEEEIFMLHHAPEEESAAAEEKRLFYVAVTRARDHLFLTHARERFVYGVHQKQKASAFLTAITDFTVAQSEKKRPAKSSKQQYSLF
ncbi:MAG: UvrD-helicase domain-containing protein [Zymomonas mobilis subsp. pomaceae]|uniref:DNA 3'-5' helicase n=1 Tax=Zymomonas mobilis subsp. pomaceae (strain ATCC 29192 / DSM 22645 / JCM 10191 / CCUG 17912 / NBRC 13757 / NCIMB 11200 / NRRL B-4491 / Barker I) TaxID=579138 RepID=F8EW89_ZYMMT|nr:UvrD-helicase domain-containing protein [Zymomonas mobilis]AEI38499.1 UvrD/REP helicase [Zymomonas mobilis subsp. pomaceae ATCC 29192]MDX5948188.1 UvrD-helicase domain-containing protein [Zymomonas mobilis subsp. pomaceae]GEB89872.1 DNA helicase [Zymomonas mobilis subsp. pomaceae]